MLCDDALDFLRFYRNLMLWLIFFLKWKTLYYALVVLSFTLDYAKCDLTITLEKIEKRNRRKDQNRIGPNNGANKPKNFKKTKKSAIFNINKELKFNANHLDAEWKKIVLLQWTTETNTNLLTTQISCNSYSLYRSA